MDWEGEKIADLSVQCRSTLAVRPRPPGPSETGTSRTRVQPGAAAARLGHKRRALESMASVDPVPQPLPPSRTGTRRPCNKRWALQGCGRRGPRGCSRGHSHDCRGWGRAASAKNKKDATPAMVANEEGEARDGNAVGKKAGDAARRGSEHGDAAGAQRALDLGGEAVWPSWTGRCRRCRRP